MAVKVLGSGVLVSWFISSSCRHQCLTMWCLIWQKREGLVECLTQSKYLLVVIWNERDILGQESRRSHHLGIYPLYIHWRSELILYKDYTSFKPKENNLEVTLDRLNRVEVGDGQNEGRGESNLFWLSQFKRETLIVWTSLVAVKTGLKKIFSKSILILRRT